MKQTSKMVMVAVALLAGASGTAWANGTEMPPPEPTMYTPPPAPMEEPAPAPPPVVATCDEGVYISGAVGIGLPEKLKTEFGGDYDMDNALVLNGAIGYDFGSARLEAAVGYQKHDLSDFDDDVSILTVMGNAYYDIDTDSSITPYLMAGAGMAHVEFSEAGDDDVFAWQVGAGLGFEVAECTTLDLGYRYLKVSEADTDSWVGKGKGAAHNVMLGLRYMF